MTQIERVEINRALAKAIAYRDCGKQADCERWAAKLVLLLQAERILTTKALEALV